MATRVKKAVKRGRAAAKFPKVATGELLTLLDFVRYAVSRFVEAELVFAHGTTDPVAEAAFLVCETLHLHPDQFESFATARVTAAEAGQILDVIARRVTTRKPAAYLVNKIYMRGLPFYVDERTIVPRSFIGELLDSHFGGESDEESGGALIDDPFAVETVLDLCTGSGCLAILAARHFPNAEIDAVGATDTVAVLLPQAELVYMTDRRANAIELQPRAEAALEKAFAVSDRVQEAALAGFSAAERKQLVGMLQRVRANLQSSEASESGDAP